MRLLKIGEPVGKGIPKKRPIYRGTYRDRPYYCDRVGEDHEVNKAFFWFVQNGREAKANDLDIVHDLGRAKEIALAYKHHAEQEFEVIEVTLEGEEPSAGEHFLGYDLSRGFFNSLL